MLHFPQTTPATIQAANRWQAKIVSAFGPKWVADGRFNCKRYVEEATAREAFRAVRPAAITVGLDIKVPACGE